MKKFMGAACVAAVLTLSACGGSAERPTSDELVNAITGDDSVFGTAIPDEYADCVADALLDSKLSNETLQAIVEGDEDYEGSDEEAAELTSISSSMASCVTGG